MTDWPLVTRVNYKKNSYLNNFLKKFFSQPYCFNLQPNQNCFFFVKHFVLIFSIIRRAFLSVYKNIQLDIVNLKNQKHLRKR